MTDNIRLMTVAKAHIEMLLVWSLEAVFDESSPEAVKFPQVNGNTEAAKSAYKAQVYRVLARLHNSPTKSRK